VSLRIHRIENGQWKENTYIVSDSENISAIIDPGENFDEIKNYVESANLKIQAIINTHGHFDHVASVADLKELFNCPFCLHSGDLKLVQSANFYRQIFQGGKNIRIPKIDIDLKEQKTVSIGSMTFEAIPTPGHTAGGVSIRIEDKVFTGDNIIGQTIGRTDLPGGNRALLENTIRTICSLPPDTEVYPGHGPMVSLFEIIKGHPEITSILSQPSTSEGQP
jgi:hydroxyacylglutathione hydrolase